MYVFVAQSNTFREFYLFKKSSHRSLCFVCAFFYFLILDKNIRTEISATTVNQLSCLTVVNQLSQKVVWSKSMKDCFRINNNNHNNFLSHIQMFFLSIWMVFLTILKK